MSRVYISAHHPGAANEVAAALAAAGHEVVSTWHRGDSTKIDRDDTAAWGAAAVANFEEIASAGALALVAGPDKYAGGKFVEAGLAIGIGIQVFTVGRVENGTLHHPAVKHAKDVAELVGLLAKP